MIIHDKSLSNGKASRKIDLSEEQQITTVSAPIIEKPRIWSLADVATSNTTSNKPYSKQLPLDNFHFQLPTSWSNQSFQPWTTDGIMSYVTSNHWRYGTLPAYHNYTINRNENDRFIAMRSQTNVGLQWNHRPS